MLVQTQNHVVYSLIGERVGVWRGERGEGGVGLGWSHSPLR